MIILGVILLVIGLIFHISLLYWIGLVLLIIGIVFLILSLAHRPVGGRTWY